MSPYEHLPTSGLKPQAEPDSSFPDHIQSLLSKYDVTTNGFLPEGPPLELLPDEYYAPWEELIRRLPESLDAGTFREEADSLPVLETSRLKTEEQWRRAYVVLCFFAHGYIWGGSRPSEVSSPFLDRGEDDVLTIAVDSATTHLHPPPLRLLTPLSPTHSNLRFSQPVELPLRCSPVYIILSSTIPPFNTRLLHPFPCPLQLSTIKDR